jgi:hypothetical protein
MRAKVHTLNEDDKTDNETQPADTSRVGGDDNETQPAGTSRVGGDDNKANPADNARVGGDYDKTKRTRTAAASPQLKDLKMDQVTSPALQPFEAMAALVDQKPKDGSAALQAELGQMRSRIVEVLSKLDGVSGELADLRREFLTQKAVVMAKEKVAAVKEGTDVCQQDETPFPKLLEVLTKDESNIALSESEIGASTISALVNSACVGANGKAIPYAAGEVTGIVHDNKRPGGNLLHDSVVFGGVAGKHSAKYLPDADTKETPSLDLEFKACKDDSGGRCDDGIFDGHHSKKKVTESLRPSKSWAKIKIRDSKFEMTAKDKLSEIKDPPTLMSIPTPTPELIRCTEASCRACADPHVRGVDYENYVGPTRLSLLSERSSISRFAGKRPEYLNLNQTGDFWLVINDMVHSQGRFDCSQELALDGAAIGAAAEGASCLEESMLWIEPLKGGVERYEERLSYDEATSTLPLPGKKEIQCSRDKSARSFIKTELAESRKLQKDLAETAAGQSNVQTWATAMSAQVKDKSAKLRAIFKEADAEKIVEHRALSASKGRKMSSYSVRSLICPLYRWDRCAKGVCLFTASNSLFTMNGHAMTSRRGRHRKPCWEEGSGTCFPLHSSPWPSRCPQRPRTRTRRALYAHDDTVLAPRGSDSTECVGTSRVEHSHDDTVLAPRGSDSTECVGTSRVEHSVVIRILLRNELPYTGSHIHVYSSAACLRLLAAADHSAAVACAFANAVAAIREGSPYTGFHGHVCSSAACLRLPSAAAHSAAAARAFAVAARTTACTIVDVAACASADLLGSSFGESV